MALSLQSVGIVTPVGLSARPACAAVRAGITRVREIDRLYDRYGEPLLGADVPGISAVDAEDRRLELMLRSIHEAFQNLAGTRPATIYLAVCLDDRPRGTDRTDSRRCVEAIRTSIHEYSGARRSTVEVVTEGNASGLIALSRYEERLAHDPSQTAVIVGADSLLHRASIEYFERDERLRDARQVRGLCPGEAGACLIVDPPSRGSGRAALARIEGIAVTKESVGPGVDGGFTAHGLTGALRTTLAATAALPRHVLCDQNGEIYRSHEWALASIRAFEGGEVPTVVHPAESIGDVGAAFAPLLIGLGAIMQNPPHPRPYGEQYDPVLVYCSSDSGARASAIVTSSGRRT
jgi:3-oxoacyl-[acyl-carrier-protein] synthase-1